MLPRNIFVTLNQILFHCLTVLKRVALQLQCVVTTRDVNQPRNKGRVLDLHQLNLTIPNRGCN